MCLRLDVDRVPDALVVGERDGRLSRPVPLVAQPTAAWGLLTIQWDHSFGSQTPSTETFLDGFSKELLPYIKRMATFSQEGIVLGGTSRLYPPVFSKG
jgi:hypothetical protein